MFLVRLELIQVTDNENLIAIFKHEEGCRNVEDVFDSNSRCGRELKKFVKDRLLANE